MPIFAITTRSKRLQAARIIDIDHFLNQGGADAEDAASSFEDSCQQMLFGFSIRETCCISAPLHLELCYLCAELLRQFG